MIRMLSRFFDIRAGETYHVALLAGLLFLLIAANNLIKILRDSIFLGHHSVSELPYLYILVALLAGVIISKYTRYTAHLSLTRSILLTNAFIVLSTGFFWLALTFFNPGWSHYAFYIWSAMAGAIAVAQVWTLANQIFTAEEGQRLFGIITAGGTLGGAAAGFGAKWAVESSFETNHLLWFVAALFVVASLLVLCADRRLRVHFMENQIEPPRHVGGGGAGGIGGLLSGSRYLKTIAAVILVSVIVSTLIDFQFKAAAKEAHPSKDALAAFFSSYYGWLSIATFFTQFVLTGRALSQFGTRLILYFTPGVLLTGSVAIMIWPSLIGAALTRMADATLRNSIHRSNMEIAYMAVPPTTMKTIKTFLDVVIERVGDASAGFIILLYNLIWLDANVRYVHFICLGLIVVWIFLLPLMRMGYEKAAGGSRSAGNIVADNEPTRV
jgi:AAA family ATP:ADP antiporter